MRTFGESLRRVEVRAIDVNRWALLHLPVVVVVCLAETFRRMGFDAPLSAVLTGLVLALGVAWPLVWIGGLLFNVYLRLIDAGPILYVRETEVERRTVGWLGSHRRAREPLPERLDIDSAADLLHTSGER